MVKLEATNAVQEWLCYL